MQLCRNELIVDNLKLVYYFFNKLGQTDLVKSYRDDIISEGMLGLIKAANSFDESRNIKFATFASMCINNQMLMFIRKIKRYYGKEVSLYQPVNIDHEGNTLCYADLLAAKGMPQEALPVMMSIEDIIKRQKPRDRRMFITYCKGYNQKEIGQMFGLSQSYVSRIINNLKTQIKKQSV